MNRCTRYMTVTAAAVALLAGCAQQPMRTTRSAAPDDILVAVSDPRQQQLWQSALASEALPPIDAIRVPTDPVQTIRVAQVPETQAARVPTLPEAVTTAVKPITLPRLAGVYGQAQVLKAEPEMLTLLMESGERLELAYRSPSRTAVAGLLPQTTAMVETLALAPASPAQRYGVAVADTNQRPALIVMQDSGDRPIAHQFRLGKISVRQVLDKEHQRIMKDPAALPPGGAAVPVRISVGDRSATFLPGTIVDAAKSGIGYDVVVYESSMHPAEAAQSDTPPFALHVGIFAPGAQ